MYHPAIYRTKLSNCPVHILRCAWQEELDISKITTSAKDGVVNIVNGCKEIGAINIILESLRQDIDLGINGMMEIYPCTIGYNEDDRLANYNINIGDLELSNIATMQQLFKICNGNLDLVQYAFDVLLTATSRIEEMEYANR